MATVVSVDIGVKNTAFCVVHGNRVVAWWIFGVSSRVAFDKTVDRFCQELHEKFPTRPDVVVIERQMCQNRKASVLSHAIQAWFRGRYNTEVKFYSPKTRNVEIHKLLGRPYTKCSYKVRKALAVQAAYKLLDGDLICPTALRTSFNEAKKKDDLADALVQAVFEIRVSG